MAKSDYRKKMDEGAKYSNEAEDYLANNEVGAALDAVESYEQARDAYKGALDSKPNDNILPSIIKGINKKISRLEKTANDPRSNFKTTEAQNSNLAKSLNPIVIGFLGAFSLVFLSNGITGNAIGSSGSSHANMMIGSLFLTVSLIAGFMLFNKKQHPHPEKKVKTKKKKKK